MDSCSQLYADFKTEVILFTGNVALFSLMLALVFASLGMSLVVWVALELTATVEIFSHESTEYSSRTWVGKIRLFLCHLLLLFQSLLHF